MALHIVGSLIGQERLLQTWKHLFLLSCRTNEGAGRVTTWMLRSDFFKENYYNYDSNFRGLPGIIGIEYDPHYTVNTAGQLFQSGWTSSATGN